MLYRFPLPGYGKPRFGLGVTRSVTAAITLMGLHLLIGAAPVFAACPDSVRYNTDFNSLSLGALSSSPNPSQDNWYASLRVGGAAAEIQSDVANAGRALFLDAPLANPTGIQTIARRDITPADLASCPVVVLSFDFLCTTSNLAATNIYNARVSVNGGPHPGYSIIEVSLSSGNGSPKSLGVDVATVAFDPGSQNNVLVPLSVGQNLSWGAWHTVELKLDHARDRLLQIVVDGQLQDLGAWKPPRSLDAGVWRRGQLTEQLNAQIEPNDTPEETLDSVYVDNIKLKTLPLLPEPLFGPKTDFATAASPRSVAIGDFNGDGGPDLAVADSSNNKVSVLLGNGNGTFGAKTDFATGGLPSSVAIGDLNGDGRRDLAVANIGSNTVSVLLGNGNGTFGAKSDFGTGVQPISVAIGDLNGDGDLDLAVANQGASTISILLGNGSWSFGTKSDFVTGSAPVSVAIGDLNADTKLDLAVANRASSTISVLLGNGLGSFSLGSSPATGSSPSSVAIGDLNGNGVPDLVAANYDSNTVSVLLGNGSGTFGAKSDFGTGTLPYSVAIADFDGDGKRDLAAANAGSNTVSVLLGNGDGTFGSKTDFGTGASPEGVAAGDLNGDGRRDLALACAASNRVSVLLNQGGAAVTDLSPVVVAPVSLNGEEGGALSVSVTASDLDDEAITSLTANLSGLPAGNDAVFTPNGTNTAGTLTWHTAPGTTGSYNVIFTASNTLSGSDTTRIDVAPAGTSITGRLLWTPSPSDTGMFDVIFRATDQFGDTTSAVTHVTVTAGGGMAAPAPSPALRAAANPTKGPVIRAAVSTYVIAGSALVLDASASGAATLTSNTAALPADNTATFATDIQPVVVAPITVSANPGEQVSISLSVSDPDGNPITSLTADRSSLPPGNNAVFTPNGTNTAGTFTWTPAPADSGNYGVTFIAANALVSIVPAVINVGNKLSVYWKLNGDGTDGAKGNTLVLSGGVTFAAGRLNQAADVNGSVPSRLQAPASHAYDLLSAGFTAEGWVKPRSFSFAADPSIARADSGGNVETWEIFVCGTGCPTGRVGMRVRHLGSLTELVSTRAINDGAFHHVATTYDGSALKLYVDGALDSSLAASGLQANVGGGTITLGDAPAGGSQFDGLIDDFRMWKVARTASQILSAMNAELGPPPTGVGDGGAPRYSFALFQNRPNPFNPHTLIRFDLAEACHVHLNVYDVQGRLVTRLIDRELGAGPHSQPWSGRDGGGRAVASGIYFYRLEAASFTNARRMVVLR